MSGDNLYGMYTTQSMTVIVDLYKLKLLYWIVQIIGLSSCNMLSPQRQPNLALINRSCHNKHKKHRAVADFYFMIHCHKKPQRANF